MRVSKQVIFGKDDADILEFLENSGCKFSTYVKKLIRQEMMGGYKPVDNTEDLLKQILTMLQTGATVRVEAESTAPENTIVANEAQKKLIKGVLGQFGC